MRLKNFISKRSNLKTLRVNTQKNTLPERQRIF
jgi:hypothetical protein